MLSARRGDGVRERKTKNSEKGGGAENEEKNVQSLNPPPSLTLSC